MSLKKLRRLFFFIFKFLLEFLNLLFIFEDMVYYLSEICLFTSSYASLVWESCVWILVTAPTNTQRYSFFEVQSSVFNVNPFYFHLRFSFANLEYFGQRPRIVQVLARLRPRGGHRTWHQRFYRHRSCCQLPWLTIVTSVFVQDRKCEQGKLKVARFCKLFVFLF